MASDIVLFAEKVERLCDFLREKLPHGDDRNKIDDLKEDAIKVQQDETLAVDVLAGISDIL